MPKLKVLLVEDYEPLREVVRALLHQEGFDVVAEASDGLDAVQKAKELSPDLILVDIGLPKLNGFEVAERLRCVTPRSKIVFVTEDCSRFVVEEAIKLGVDGYVSKMHIHDELMRAIDTVLAGKLFIGSGTDSEGRAPTAGQPVHRRHEVLIYSDEAVLLESFTHYVATALREGRPAIAIAAKSQLDSLTQKLTAQGVDVPAATRLGAFFPLDVGVVLAAFMVDNVPDSARFKKVTSDIMDAACRFSGAVPARIAACGVCAPTLWVDGKTNAAVLVERLWDDLKNQYALDTLCAYPSNSFHAGRDQTAFNAICGEHTAVYSL